MTVFADIVELNVGPMPTFSDEYKILEQHFGGEKMNEVDNLWKMKNEENGTRLIRTIEASRQMIYSHSLLTNSGIVPKQKRQDSDL